MINPRELRIGNILQGDNGNRVIASLDTTHFTDVFDISTLYRDAQGIPIDSNWLKGFGFEKDELHDCYVIYKHPDVPVAIEFYDGQIHLVGFNIADTMDHIQYVHQLQNLYFALTGEELSLG